MNPLHVVIAAMLIQQAVAYMSTLVLPVLAPAIGAELGFSPGLVGFYTGLVFLASSLGQLSCGNVIARLGPIRSSQVALCTIATAMLMGAGGVLWLFALSALVMGLGNSISTPASSHLLARFSPPRWAPLIFSIKQTGVPVGGVMAGQLAPLFLVLFGWQGAFVAMAAMCLALALLLQPMRARFDDDRDRTRGLRPTNLRDTIRGVLGNPPLRALAIAMFAFVGLQSLFGSFFTTLMTHRLGHSLDTAGNVFTIALAAAIPARILWGWAGSRWVHAGLMLAILAVVMSMAAVATGLYDRTWSLTAVTAVAIVYSASAIGWHGLLLSEVARLAPPGQIGTMTGGVLAFGGAGMMLYPVIYGTILDTTGSYGIGFFAAALPALAVGWMLVGRWRADRAAPA